MSASPRERLLFSSAADVAVRARVTARGVHRLGTGLLALGPNLEAKLHERILLLCAHGCTTPFFRFRRADEFSVPHAQW